jgi:hypothetical protein
MSFSDREKSTLTALLDLVVPPSGDGRLPGAGELGVADFVEESLRERPELQPGLKEGLALLEELAAARGSRRFGELDAAERRAVLDAAAERQPAFLGLLVFQTYFGYYRAPRVLEALGVEPRPPYPEGYEVPATDFSLLDPVRRKERFYREP